MSSRVEESTLAITDLDICRYVSYLYQGPESPATQWDHIDTGADDDQNYWAAKRLDSLWLIVNRGSQNNIDYLRDLTTLPVDSPLGKVHGGFWDGIEVQWNEIQKIIGTDPWIASGHSLGAARCCLLAGLGALANNPPRAFVRFGEPRPAYAKLKEILGSVRGRSYRNMDAWGHDRITDVPFNVPFFPFIHPQPLIDITASPVLGDLGIFSYHHIGLYIKALGG